MCTVRPLREPTIFIVTPGRQQRRKRGVLRCVINIYLPLCDFMTTRIGFGVRNTPGSEGKGSTHIHKLRKEVYQLHRKTIPIDKRRMQFATVAEKEAVFLLMCLCVWHQPIKARNGRTVVMTPSKRGRKSSFNKNQTLFQAAKNGGKTVPFPAFYYFE